MPSPASDTPPLPAMAHEAVDTETFKTVISKLTKCIITAVMDGRSVTASNKRVIIRAAEEIQCATTAFLEVAHIASASSLPPPQSAQTDSCPNTLKDEIVACVREEIGKLRSLATQRSTYAQVANTPRQTSPAKSMAPTFPTNKPALIISTAKPTATRQEVVTAFKKQVSFKQVNYAPSSIRGISNNKLRIEFDSITQRDETLKRLEGCPEVKAETARCLKPMCILKGISTDTPAEELIELTKNQNEEVARLITDEEDLKVRFKRQNRNPNLYNAVLIAHPRVWRQIITCGRLCVDHQRVHVQDFSPFLQCHKCLQFGHTKTKCTVSENPCAHCAETGHNINSCPVNGEGKAPTCYNCYRHNTKFNTNTDTKHKATDPRVKACIIAKPQCGVILGHSEYSSPNLCVVHLQVGQQKVYFASVYVEPDLDQSNTLALLDNFLKATDKSTHIIGGDFNGWHHLWGSNRTNARGNDVLDIIYGNDLAICNNGSTPTFETVTHGRDRSSIIDLTLCSTSIYDRIQDWKVNLDVCPSSQHNAIEFTLVNNCNTSKPVNDSTFSFNSSKAKWPLFKNSLHLRMITSDILERDISSLNPNQIESLIKDLTEIIRAACSDSMPIKGTGPHKTKPPWWSKSLEDQKKAIIQLHHQIHRAKARNLPITDLLAEHHQLKLKYSQNIRYESTKNFKKFCQLQTKENAWSLTNRLLKDTAPRRPPTTLKIGNGFTKDAHDSDCTTTPLLPR
ncbi:uncharacterized protein LOC123722161 [Papilio machaon]|uniref:uncharacterized protein LOC123722161 n=1 Tax=Papilio machaon TaxID=76193 RepID=UPI001E666050|nr:uncharacterized protein LOC123722161 [Papilio machaon]